MGKQERREWIHDQLREKGWSDRKIKRGWKYNKGLRQVALGGLGSLILIGFPWFCLGLLRAIIHKRPGKEYRKAMLELKKEFDRRDTSGEALYAPVGEDWWSKRFPN